MTSGMVYLETGKLALARNAYQAALDLARRNHSEGDVASGLILLAQIAVAAGNPVEAEEFARQALTLAQDWANPDDRVDILAIRSRQPHSAAIKLAPRLCSTRWRLRRRVRLR